MNDRVMTHEMLEAFRADLGRWGQQRAKLEKVQKMRQAIERLCIVSRHLGGEINEAD